jgi:ribosomal protein L40E
MRSGLGGVGCSTTDEAAEVLMAEVQLTWAEVQGGNLPAICMQCGAPATDMVSKKYTTDKVDLVPPPPEPVGCLVLFPIIGLLKLVSWSQAKTMTVRTPLCHKHAHGWFVWSSLDATSITDEAIVITGVSDQFAQAWQEQRAANHGQERHVVKVRCRKCEALNTESARFCDQCGASL